MRDILYPLRVLHGRVHDWCTDRIPLYKDRFLHPNAVYLVLTPEHGNLGDHAIAQSENEVLTELGIPYIEYSGRKLEELQCNNCLDIMNGRTILINGGGNLGGLWPDIETMMQNIVKNNPKSKILILPNSIYYDDSEEDNLFMKQSAAIYNSHPHLKLYAREYTSYEVMKAIYHNVAIVPDMVLRMNKCEAGIKRNGCIICLREDREKTISSEEEAAIHTQASLLFGDTIRYVDMKKPYLIPIENREEELNKQFDAFRHAELVITDRLHGMIFCAITGTPCIVFSSKSPKMRGCYKWIQNLEYIQFCENVSEIGSIYSSISRQEWYYDNRELLPLYEPLKSDIRMLVKRK